jgi:hypothetical protein
MPNTQTLTQSLLAGSEQEILDHAVTCRSPDRDVPVEELAWWLALQERLETRAELAAAGLL